MRHERGFVGVTWSDVPLQERDSLGQYNLRPNYIHRFWMRYTEHRNQGRFDDLH